jgi:4-hydroxy-3-methylbut-2-enyl diphosphate reductase
MVTDGLRQNRSLYTLGPLIHNPQVLADLARQGLRQVQAVQDVPPGGTLVIRSHGAPPDVYEACAAQGLTVLDATCPVVGRIHGMVAAYSDQGDAVIIVGQADHPEVQGTAGWAKGPVYILADTSQVETLPPLSRALLVSQTTHTVQGFRRLAEALRGRIPDLRVAGTICGATARRQDEARALAAQTDAMLVVGGKASANTRKLLQTCLSICPRSVAVETAEDIPPGFLRPGDHIGITAGASTPEWSLKEVITRMNDMEKQEQGLDQAQSDFLADIEATLVKIRPGQTVTGTVVQIAEDEVCVNIGYKSDGLIQRADLISTDCKIGDEIEVEVVKVNDGEGNVVLSQRNIVNRKNWDALMEQYEQDAFVQGVGKEAVKGGLIADVAGVRAFVPASQLSLRYVEKIDEFVGKPLTLKIIEVDKTKKRVVASYKAYLAQEAAARKQEVWGKLVKGDVVHGVVRRLTDFGAFVDVGGVDGLIHVTDLSWGRVKHPSDVVTPNQEVDVLLLSIDPVRERIQLGYKQLQKRPWDSALEKYAVGGIVEGKVVRITTFGAFVELEPGLDGLVHISQCALSRIAKVEDAVHVGDTVRVKVLGVDPAAKRISLSIREALEEEAFDGIPGDELTEDIGPAEQEDAPAQNPAPTETLTPAEEPAAEDAVPAKESAPEAAPVEEPVPAESLAPVEASAEEPAPAEAPAKKKRAAKKKAEDAPAEEPAAEESATGEA